MAHILLRGGYLLDLDRDLGTGDLLAENGEIVRVGGDIEAPGAEVIDARGRVVIPGLINAHTHSNQSIERGLCDRLPLDAWMVVASYGGAGARLQPRDLYLSAMVGAIEMLSTGTTSVLDCARSDASWFDEGLDAILQAYDDVGIRATVAAQYSDLDFYSSIPMGLIDESKAKDPQQRIAVLDEVLDRAERYLDRWEGRNPRLAPSLGPSSVPRCSTELFEASVELAKRKGARLQTHLLSAKSQVPVADQRFGGPTVEYLQRLGALESWASYAHGIWLSDDEVALLGDTDAVIVHNPVSNLKLGAGIAPVPAMRRAGVRVALGSDGASSNDSQNMFETTKAAAIVHRVTSTPDLWPGAADALQMCWEGGAAAMGQPIGRLALGCRADLTLLRTPSLFIAPKEHMLHQLVYAELGRSVDTVLVDGRVVVRDGRVVTVDVESLLQEAQELVSRIWSALPERQQRFEEARPMLEELERAVGALPLAFARTCG